MDGATFIEKYWYISDGDGSTPGGVWSNIEISGRAATCLQVPLVCQEWGYL